MLVLERKPTQRIILDLGDGREVVITYVERYGEKIRVGLDAPRSVTIFREEIRDKFQKPKEAS